MLLGGCAVVLFVCVCLMFCDGCYCGEFLVGLVLVIYFLRKMFRVIA